MPEIFKDVEITRSGYSEDGRGWHESYIRQGVDNTVLLMESLKKIIPVRESHPTMMEYMGWERTDKEKLDGKAFNFRVKKKDEFLFIICDFELSGELLESWKAEQYPNISTGFQFDSTNQQGQLIGHSVNHVGLFGNTGVADTDLNKSARIEKSNFYITEFKNMEQELSKKQLSQIEKVVKKEMKSLDTDGNDDTKTQIQDYLMKATTQILPNVIAKSSEIIGKAKEEEDEEDENEDRFKSIQKSLDGIEKRLDSLEGSNKAKEDDEDKDKDKSAKDTESKSDDKDADNDKSLKQEIDNVFKQMLSDGNVTSDDQDIFQIMVEKKGLGYAKKHYQLNSKHSKNPGQFNEVLGTLNDKMNSMSLDTDKAALCESLGISSDQAKNAMNAFEKGKNKGLVMDHKME